MERMIFWHKNLLKYTHTIYSLYPPCKVRINKFLVLCIWDMCFNFLCKYVFRGTGKLSLNRSDSFLPIAPWMNVWLSQCVQRAFGFTLKPCACNTLSVSASAQGSSYPCPWQSTISKPIDPKNSLIVWYNPAPIRAFLHPETEKIPPQLYYYYQQFL